jgi:hypothetical protein
LEFLEIPEVFERKLPLLAKEVDLPTKRALSVWSIAFDKLDKFES